MKPTSKEVLEKISMHCSNQLTLYKFNTTTLQISEKYRKGRITALKYLGELTYYYLQKEKGIQEEFKDQVLKQLKLHACLDDAEYKRGLYDALNEVLDFDQYINI